MPLSLANSVLLQNDGHEGNAFTKKSVFERLDEKVFNQVIKSELDYTKNSGKPKRRSG